MANPANFHCRNTDFGFSSARGLFKRNLQVIAQVRTAINIGMPTTGTKYISKYIAERISKPLCAACTAYVGIYAGMAMLIICRALPWISQYFVGFLGFLEMLFRLWIIRIAVRMMLHRQLTIGFLDFVLAGVAVNAQHFIIVAFAHISFLDKQKSTRLILYSTTLPSSR